MKFTIDNIELKIEKFKNKLVSIEKLLAFATENSCSDLFIKVSEQPYINRYGKLYIIPCMNINNLIWNEFAKDCISSERNAKYVREKCLDLAYQIKIPENSKYFNKYEFFRYRLSVGFSQDKSIATFRMITPDLPSFDTINFPTSVQKVLNKSFENKNGIVLFCGPTGSGKSIFSEQKLKIRRLKHLK